MRYVVLMSAATVAACAGFAHAQSVEFRIVERTGQTSVTSGDTLLELAVQAKVTGGNLGAFSFDIVANGEQDSWGTLAKGRINVSATNHNYFTGSPWAAGTTVGQFGMASAYTGLVATSGSSAAFGGSINTSAGTFTNNPGSQEIGLVTGRLMALNNSAMLTVPGLDPNGEGNPLTWSGYGTGASPNPGDLASLPSSLAGPFFAGDQFIDIYRFRYTVTNLTTIRTLTFGLRNILAENFTRFVYGPGLWGAQDTTVPAGNISGAPLTATVSGFSLIIPAPGAAAMLGMGGLLAMRRRRN